LVELEAATKKTSEVLKLTSGVCKGLVMSRLLDCVPPKKLRHVGNTGMRKMLYDTDAAGNYLCQAKELKKTD